MKASRLVYAGLLELEFVLALCVTYFMGAERWTLCIISLVLTLLIGFATSLWYWKLLEKTNHDNRR